MEINDAMLGAPPCRLGNSCRHVICRVDWKTQEDDPREAVEKRAHEIQMVADSWPAVQRSGGGVVFDYSVMAWFHALA